MRRIIVCGSRHWRDESLLRYVLSLCSPGGMSEKVQWVHGGCPTGADSMVNGAQVEIHEADWKAHGKAAGPIRNREMAESGADLCIGFLSEGLPNRGTLGMLKLAEKHKIPCLFVHDNGSVWMPHYVCNVSDLTGYTIERAFFSCHN